MQYSSAPPRIGKHAGKKKLPAAKPVGLINSRMKKPVKKQTNRT